MHTTHAFCYLPFSRNVFLTLFFYTKVSLHILQCIEKECVDLTFTTTNHYYSQYSMLNAQCSILDTELLYKLFEDSLILTELGKGRKGITVQV